MIWNGNFGFQGWLEESFGAGFHDFEARLLSWRRRLAGFGGVVYDARTGRYGDRGTRCLLDPVAGIGQLAFVRGSVSMWSRNRWGVSGLVAVNSLMAMVGGIPR